MSERRTEKQLSCKIDGFDRGTVERVLKSLVKEHEIVYAGYGDQLRVDLIFVGDEKVLSDRLVPWIEGGIMGVFGIGVRGKIDSMKEWVKIRHEDGVK